MAKGKTSREAKAGISMCVSRVGKILKRGNPEKRCSPRAPVYLAGALEKVTRTVLGCAADHAQNKEPGNVAHKRINTMDLIKAVRSDPDLSRAFGGFAFSSLAAALKPIDHILPADEQRERQQAKKVKAAEKAAEKARRSATVAT
jgi:hypothetical protein